MLDSEASEPAVAAALRHVLGSPGTDRHLPGLFVYSGSLLARLRRLDPKDFAVANEWDVYPCTTVYLELDRFGDSVAQQALVLRVGLRMVESTADSVVLLFNGERPWLLRRRGEGLLLNRELWDESRLQLVQLPYELRHLPVL